MQACRRQAAFEAFSQRQTWVGWDCCCCRSWSRRRWRRSRFFLTVARRFEKDSTLVAEKLRRTCGHGVLLAREGLEIRTSAVGQVQIAIWQLAVADINVHCYRTREAEDDCPGPAGCEADMTCVPRQRLWTDVTLTRRLLYEAAHGVCDVRTDGHATSEWVGAAQPSKAR